MKKNLSVLFCLVMMQCIIAKNVKAQGCSDAGFCTMNSFKPQDEVIDRTENNQLKFGVSYGAADNNISALANYIEYHRAISKRFSFDLKLTTLAQVGNSISVFGLSDVFLNGNLGLTDAWTVTAGIKVPLTDGNKMLDNKPLPMDYQSSLGTYDLLFGTAYQIQKFQFVAAIQQPLTQNSNSFVAEDYPNTSALNSFLTTNKFVRAGDVLLRVSYPFIINDKLSITPSILPIYHLAEDRYTDSTGTELNIKGSSGLTVNANAFIDYALSKSSSLQLNMGFPFVVRDVRPDGLTRGFVMNLEYRIRF